MRFGGIGRCGSGRPELLLCPYQQLKTLAQPESDLSTAGGPPTEVGRGWSWGLPVPFPDLLHIHYHPLDVSQRMILTRQDPLFAHIPHARLHFLALL